MEKNAQNSIWNKARQFLFNIWYMNESGIIIPTIIFGFLVYLVNPVFLSKINVTNILRSTGFTLISAIGMTLVLISGGIDLSVGSVLGLGGMFVGIFMVNLGIPIWLSILLTLLIGLFVGFLNGFTIIKFKIPPMIMTLGMMYMARGIVYTRTKGLPIYPMPDAFQAIEQVNLFGVPKIVFICLILSAIFHVILTSTAFGRSIYAVGGNISTAKLSGINTERVILLVYMINGMMASLTGIMMASRLGSAQPSSGTGNEMNVIAACIIGGTSTFGGRGTILGTAIGALFMSMLSNSMTLLRVDVYYQNLAIGAVLVFAVILDQYKRTMAESGARNKSHSKA